MRLVRWIGLGLAALVVIAATVAGGSVFLALDWGQTHTKATSDLPFYEPGMADGLYQIRANDMVFRARIFGSSNSGPGIIMLHGHPETSIMWKPLATAAAERGYRVIAFDQRGYSPGARPKGVEPYLADNQVSDVFAIADAAGFDRFHLVGHDWGSVVAWATAILHPERLISLTTMAIPHPQTLVADVVEDPPAYIMIFSVPWFAETTLLFNDMAGYRAFYTSQSEQEINEYLGVFSEPGASTAALNWYRGIQESIQVIDSVDPNISLPTLFIYGDEEDWVTPAYLEHQRTLMGDDYAEVELEADHWLIQDQRDAVVSAVLSHVDRTTPSEDAPAESDL
ncbi:MAG: alpha/beta hydrolase [Pseudomonadota bacterium]